MNPKMNPMQLQKAVFFIYHNIADGIGLEAIKAGVCHMFGVNPDYAEALIDVVLVKKQAVL